MIDHFIDDLMKVQRIQRELLEKQEEMKSKSNKKTSKELEEIKGLIEQQIEECKGLEELSILRKDAYAHQQENLNSFMITYLGVAFCLLLVEIGTFLTTPISFMFLEIYVDATLLSLNAIFSGLLVFVYEFMTYTKHKEIK